MGDVLCNLPRGGCLLDEGHKGDCLTPGEAAQAYRVRELELQHLTAAGTIEEMHEAITFAMEMLNPMRNAYQRLDNARKNAARRVDAESYPGDACDGPAGD